MERPTDHLANSSNIALNGFYAQSTRSAVQHPTWLLNRQIFVSGTQSPNLSEDVQPQRLGQHIQATHVLGAANAALQIDSQRGTFPNEEVDAKATRLHA